MKGYKDTSKTHYTKGGPAGGAKGAAKHSQVMAAFRAPAGKPVEKRGCAKTTS